MKKLESLFISIAMLCCLGSYAQTDSYGQIESRFYKPQLNKTDSLAFEELGMVKVRELLDYSKLHQQPSTYNSTHDPFIFENASALFLEPDSVPIAQVLNKLSYIQSSTKRKEAEITTQDQSGIFKKVIIGSDKYNCTLNILLLKAPKSFGKEEKLIWQVFLSKPVFSF